MEHEGIMTRPNPQSVRDLKLMYDTTTRFNGNIEHKRLTDIRCSRDYHEGDIVSMSLLVTPNVYADTVCVTVEREQVTNLRGSTYTPKKIIDWKKEYDFDGFKKSPFYQMCIDAWTSGCSPSWDTSLMDEHEVGDNDTSWWIGAHVYEHADNWYGCSTKTGSIDHVGIALDEDGLIELSITHDGVRDDFFDGDIWELRDMIREHEEMTEKLKKLKEHGIDLDGGTLSIRLWE
jgi:hypothetical protein